MPALETFGDLLLLTTNRLRKGKRTNIMMPLQRYPAFKRIINRKAVKDRAGGALIDIRVQYKTNGSARNVEPYQSDDVNDVDTFTSGNVPFRFTEASYVFDERIDHANSAPERIYDLVKSKRDAAVGDLAKKMESDFWSKPVSSSDTKQPYGVKYWIVGNTASTGGFDGGNPAGFTAGAGNIDSATYTGWANWTDNFVTVNSADFQTKLWEATYKTDFEGVVDGDEYRNGTSQYGYYCGYDIIPDLRKMAQAQNQSIGWDLDPGSGKVMYQRTPIDIVSQIDGEAGTPFFGIDWGCFWIAVDSRMWMRETEPSNAQTNSHNVYSSHIDNKWQPVCDNRRKQFVLHTSSYAY